MVESKVLPERVLSGRDKMSGLTPDVELSASGRSFGVIDATGSATGADTI